MRAGFITATARHAQPGRGGSVVATLQLPDCRPGRNFTSDGYVEYTWHAPTVRPHTGRPVMRDPATVRLARRVGLSGPLMPGQDRPGMAEIALVSASLDWFAMPAAIPGRRQSRPR